jgi:hypothetical protein
MQPQELEMQNHKEIKSQVSNGRKYSTSCNFYIFNPNPLFGKFLDPPMNGDSRRIAEKEMLRRL